MHFKGTSAFKFGDRRIHRHFLRFPEGIFQSLAGKACNGILNRNSLIRQQSGKGIFAIRIVFQKARGIAAVKIHMFAAVHHFHIFLLSGFRGKRTVPYPALLINVLPLSIKGQGIDKVHHGTFRNFVQDIRNHAVRVFTDPVIDVLQRGIVKSRLVDRCSIVVRIGLKEILLHFQPVVIPEPDGIGKMDLVFVAGRQIAHIEVQIFIQIRYRKTENFLHLRKGLALRSICCHSKSTQYGDR